MRATQGLFLLDSLMTGAATARLSGPRGVAAIEVLLRRTRLNGSVRDVLLAHGRVRAIGADLARGAPGLESLGDGLRQLDLDGAVLLPGLRDEHVHLEQWAAARRRIDVSSAGSAGHAASLVAQATASNPDVDNLAGAGPAVLLGQGFRDALWPDPPAAAVLDEAVPDRPVVLISADLHTAWCNTQAMMLLGLRAAIVREDEAMSVLARAGRVDPAVMDSWVLEATRAAAGRGVTGVVDFEYGDTVRDWVRRAGVTLPPVRVGTAIWPEWLESTIGAGLASGDPLPGLDDPAAADRLRVGPLKLFVDGSLGTRTAYCHDRYPGAADGEANGILRTGPLELERLLRRATAHGLDVAVHAIGDRATSIALDAFETVGCGGRIEHAQQVLEPDLRRFAALGVVASIQPRHAADDRDAADLHWSGSTDRAFPYAALVGAGAQVVLGSDAPVAPLDPWDGIASAVHRSVDARPAWHPEQHLTLERALAAASGGRRTVRVGDVADLVVVAEPPADLLAREGPDGLRRTEVLGTLVAGRWTHCGPFLTD